MVAMNITQIEQSIKKLPGKSDQNFSASKTHIFCRKNACDLDNMQIRYSFANFHHHTEFSNTDNVQGNSIEMYVFEVFDELGKYFETTFDKFCTTEQKPVALCDAHHNLGIIIEQCSSFKSFASDEERLHLFTLYEQMTSRGTK